ncbi:MATE family efflux transporter [Neolewinella persica]|uniref:MATE family efflux transporter n=1 Tax=Neolewinella persica TaxID=70998 RepID=UPI00038299F8|nr:MATE family efflux transporter [Neolewinella persica]
MNRDILRLAIPNILSNISVPLLSSFDTGLMGSLGGRYIAAVGLGAMALNFVYWNFGFLRMSTTGITAQAYGKQDEEAQMLSLVRAGGLALLLAGCLLALQYPFAELIHWLLNLRADQVELVDDYFYLRILAAPAALLQMVLFGWFFGRQNATFPLVLTLIVNVANMVLSFYLVRTLGWGIKGVALGTVAAQYLGLVIGLGLLWYECRRHALPLKIVLLHLRPRLEKRGKEVEKKGERKAVGKEGGTALKEFLTINRDIFIRTLCLTLSFAFFYNRANALDVGTAVVAANVILLQLVNWLSYGVDGFAFAAESLVGRYHGAGQPEKLRRLLKLLFAWGMGLAVIYALVYALGNTHLLALFAPEDAAPETLAEALRYLPIVVAFCILATPCYLLDGIYVGLTAAHAMRQTMLLAFAGYLLSYYLLGRHYANWGLWGSLLFFMVLRAVMQGWWLWKGRVGSIQDSGSSN